MRPTAIPLAFHFAMNNIKLMIGLPAYGNVVTVGFCESLLQLSFELQKYGIDGSRNWIGNESLIQRARNGVANDFLHSDCTHLLFIDVDLTFRAEDIVQMISWAVHEDLGIIGLPYSIKDIDFKRLEEAVLKGVPTEELRGLTARVATNWDPNNPEIDITKPVQVTHVATGLMLISKKVFQQLAQAHPEWQYQLMGNEKTKTGRTTAFTFFNPRIDEITGTYLSEDYAFCQDWREIGGTCWLCPWAQTSHMGTYHYQCNIPKIAEHGLTLLNR
jgi:hypothetical protein